MEPLDPRLLADLRAIVDLQRLRILARLAGGPADATTLAAELRVPLPVVRKQLELLVHAGIAEAGADRPGHHVLRPDRIGRVARELARLDREAEGVPPGPEGAWPHEGETLADTLGRLAPTPDEARTLRAHLVDGRLRSIPAQVGKRRIVLRFLLERVFTEDRDYPEREVNQRLALFHPDVAALRRYLVDERYVDRAAGRYRRRSPLPDATGRGSEGDAGGRS